MFPILNPSPTSLPIPSLWVIPVHQPQASCILHRTWTGDSFLIWYYTCFNAILPNHPTLSLSHSPKDCSIDLYLFCCLTYRVTIQFSSVQSLGHVRLFATPWIAARQASLSITNSRSLPKLTSIESVMPSSHLILCCPLLLLPPIPPSIRVFSNESVLRIIRWPKYWSFSFSIHPSNEYSGLLSFRMDWFDLLAV